VPDLVDEARAAGLPVTLRLTGGTDVPDGPALAAYRIVQEALTNVRKHAPGAPTSVEVAVSTAAIELAVTNAPPPRPAAAASAHGGGHDGGHGVPGMRERARVYGGSLDVGPSPDAGWTVRARIPLGAA
jgi:signal transduction histidine kinase